MLEFARSEHRYCCGSFIIVDDDGDGDDDIAGFFSPSFSKMEKRCCCGGFSFSCSCWYIF